MIVDSVFRLVASDDLSKAHAVNNIGFVDFLVSLKVWPRMLSTSGATRIEKAHLVRIYGPGLCNFHPIAHVDKILVAAFLLLRYQSVAASHKSMLRPRLQPDTYPFTPITKFSANSNGMLNWARFGTSRKRICARSSSMRPTETDSGSTPLSSSSSSTRLVGSRTDYT
jgi:hypothetical protein